MLIEETWVNKTENCQSGEADLYEPFTENTGELFRAFQKEYGRCVSKIYIDNPSGDPFNPIIVGWVFEKRQRYDDSKNTFLLETWITLHEKKPTVTRQFHYHELKRKA